MSASDFIDWLRYTERRAVVREMLVDLVIRKAALDRGWKVADEELQSAVDILRRTHKLYRSAEMVAWLGSRGISLEDLEKQLELQNFRGRLQEAVCGDDEVLREFAENRREYDRARLSRIVVSEQGVADEIRLQLDEGADFAHLALRYSLDVETKNLGGELGLVRRTSLGPTIESAVFSAKEGELIGPLSADGLFHLLCVRQLLVAELTPEIASAIRGRLFENWLTQQLQTIGFAIMLPASE